MAGTLRLRTEHGNDLWGLEYKTDLCKFQTHLLTDEQKLQPFFTPK